MLQKINRGDVYFYNFGFDYDGSIEGKCRPCVIVSNDKGNNHGTTALVAPITTRSKESCKPWQVHFQNGTKSQIILCEQIKVINIAKLYNYQGRLDVLTMRAVDEALAIEFDLNVTQKEQDSTEFLRRLDNTLDRIVNKYLNDYNVRLNEKLNLISNNNISNNDFNDIKNDINEIKSIFNQNADNMDKMLSSLIDLFTKLKSNEVSITKDASSKQIKSKSVKSKLRNSKPKYTVEYARDVVTDYYNMDRESFMTKYSLNNTSQVNNKLTTLRGILKRNGIDYKNIKHKITVYNLNDLNDDEREKLLKNTKIDKNKLNTNHLNNEINNSSDIKDSNLEVYKTANRCGTNSNPGYNKGVKHTPNRFERFDYTVENCLDFIEEWNTTPIELLSDKYQVTNKQISQRKYLICKWLVKHNVEFKVCNKRKK